MAWAVKKGSPRDPDFSLGVWPFATVEGVHDQIDDGLVR